MQQQLITCAWFGRHIATQFFDKFFAAIVSLLIEPRVRGRVNDQDPVLGQSLGDGLIKTVEFSGRQMLDDVRCDNQIEGPIIL